MQSAFLILKMHHQESMGFLDMEEIQEEMKAKVLELLESKTAKVCIFPA
jgi:hypothetical protein